MDLRLRGNDGIPDPVTAAVIPAQAGIYPQDTRSLLCRTPHQDHYQDHYLDKSSWDELVSTLRFIPAAFKNPGCSVKLPCWSGREFPVHYFASRSPYGNSFAHDKKFTYRGVLELADGRRPFFAQSIAIGRQGMIYTIAKVRPSRSQKPSNAFKIDLLSFPNPLSR